MDTVTAVMLAGAGLAALQFAATGPKPRDPVTNRPPGSGPIIISPPSPVTSGDCRHGQVTGDFANMVEADPQFGTRMLVWQHQRTEQGADAWDWGAFRGFLRGQGMPDPGPQPPILFCAYDGTGGESGWN